jgi:ribosomal protein S24E
MMKTITVRRIEPSLAKKLKQEANKEGKSVNQLVIETIKQYLGMKKEKRFTIVYHDMDHIFGRWSEEEFEQIQGKIDSERKVEKELWS